MKIQISGLDLAKAMKVLSKAVDKRTSFYSGVLFCHDENVLKMRGTNGHQICEVRVPVNGGNGEEFALDAETLDRVSRNAGATVNFNVDGTTCIIQSNGRVRTQVIKANVPEISDVGGTAFIVSGADLKALYQRVKDCVSTIDTRIELTGVSVVVSAGKLTMTAMDGDQIARGSIQCDGPDAKILIPSVFMDRVCDAMNPDETVKVVTDGTRVMMGTGSFRITGALINKQYPEIDKIIPTAFAIEARVDTNVMKEALRGCEIVADGNKLVRMTLDNGVITVENRSDSSEYMREVECNMYGGPLKIAFNRQYLVNALGCLGGSEVVMKFNKAVTPVIITEDGFDGVRVLMPVRV